jgi:hypothetical protein
MSHVGLFALRGSRAALALGAILYFPLGAYSWHEVATGVLAVVALRRTTNRTSG